MLLTSYNNSTNNYLYIYVLASCNQSTVLLFLLANHTFFFS